MAGRPAVTEDKPMLILTAIATLLVWYVLTGLYRAAPVIARQPSRKENHLTFWRETTRGLMPGDVTQSGFGSEMRFVMVTAVLNNNTYKGYDQRDEGGWVLLVAFLTFAWPLGLFGRLPMTTPVAKESQLPPKMPSNARKVSSEEIEAGPGRN